MRKTEHMQCLKGDSHVQKETVMSKRILESRRCRDRCVKIWAMNESALTPSAAKNEDGGARHGVKRAPAIIFFQCWKRRSPIFVGVL
jgi:hypothetical protein